VFTFVHRHRDRVALLLIEVVVEQPDRSSRVRRFAFRRLFGPGPAISAISGEGSGVRSKPAFPVTRLVISRIAAPPSSRVNTDLRGDWNEPPSSRVHTGDWFSSSGSTSSRSSTRRSIRRPMDPCIRAFKRVKSSQAQEYV
jgi:hypothetical protein